MTCGPIVLSAMEMSARATSFELVHRLVCGIDDPGLRARLLLPLLERRGIVEQEVLVAIEPHQVADVVERREPDRGRTRRAMDIRGVHGNREHGAGRPRELADLPVRQTHFGLAAPVHDIEDFFIRMPHGLRRAADGNVEHEQREKIAAPFHMADRACDAEARPRRRLDLREVDAGRGDDGHALRLRPIVVRVDEIFFAKSRMHVAGSCLAHGAPFPVKGLSSMNGAMRDCTPLAAISFSHIAWMRGS